MYFNCNKIWKLVFESLSAINKDFVKHGERVAFLMLRFSATETLTARALSRRVICSLFHDIGAYKTNQDAQDNLLLFDASGTYPHALEGYLFLKYFSPLAQNAEPVLYHHALYSERTNPNIHNKETFYEGCIIHLLDRFDVMNGSGIPLEQIITTLSAQCDGMFDFDMVQRFINLLRTEDLCQKLADGSYAAEINQYLSSSVADDLAIEDYLRMLSFTFEVYSPSTLLHSNTTAMIAHELAKYLSVDQDACNKIFIAGIIHDLGKIKTPFCILEKPASLTAQEMTEMRQHVVHTKELVNNYFDPVIVQIASRHHEKLNGCGYPDGLRAPELTLADRIMCVADIISALYAKRSYKNSYDMPSISKILREMTEKGELDLTVVDAFFAHSDEIWHTVHAQNDRILARYRNAQEEHNTLIRTPLGR